MRSDKQIEASRRNGAKSRGPATAAGKRKSSANALRHGLLAQHLLLPNESASVFEAYFQQLVARMRPADTVELALVEEMAINHWRLRRAMAIETRLSCEAMEQCAAFQPDAEPLAAAFQTLAAGGQIGLLNLYENRVHRMFQRSLQNFLRLRSELPPALDPEPLALHPAANNSLSEVAAPCGTIDAGPFDGASGHDQPGKGQSATGEPVESHAAQVPGTGEIEQTNPRNIANADSYANRNPSPTQPPGPAQLLTTYALLTQPVTAHSVDPGPSHLPTADRIPPLPDIPESAPAFQTAAG